MKDRRPSLRLLVGVIVLAPILAISLALLVLSGYTSNRIESQLSGSLVRATSTVVTREIDRVIGDAQWISDLYTYRVKNGVLPTTPSPLWDRLMVGTLAMRSSLSSLSFATPDGRCVMVMRVNDQLIAGHADGNAAWQTREYSVTPQGEIVQPPLRTYRYDVFRRPWFVIAQRSPMPVWTPVYAWFDNSQQVREHPPVPALGYTRTIYANDGKLIGVLSVDVTLATVDRLLRENRQNGGASVAILDHHGSVVSDSSGLPERLGIVLPQLDSINDPELRTIARAAAEAPTPGGGHQTVIDGRYVSVERLKKYDGIDWRLAMAVPEHVINADTAALQWNMAWIGGACVVAALLLGLSLARRVAAPIQRMAAGVHRVGQGDFDVQFEPQTTRELAGLTAALSEMTRQLKEQVALRAAKEVAESSNRARSSFFARATHELRTPLNAIIGYSELIEEQDSVRADTQTHDDIRRVLQASKQLLTVINDVLDMAKIESGKLQVAIREVNIPALIHEVRETTLPLVHRGQNELLTDIAPDVGVLHTDADKLKQVLLNLLSNAARFTQSGTITLLAEQDRAHLHLAVRDNGCGIPADQMSRLFEPFYQVTTNRGGTGLGLTITQQLTHALGGMIEIQSAPGQGTTVDLYFPLHDVARDAGRDAGEPTNAATQPSAATASATDEGTAK